ncbi:MAG: hypothetical protein HY928_12960 [Elusimicrobia bacterium]|nr:hypothetical protein [Elusimicrobiota bacterium]
MDPKTLKEVLSWMRSTDLTEVAWNRGGTGFSLSSDTAPAMPSGAFPEARVVSVSSAEVGVFRAAPLGKSPKAQAGDEVSAGTLLGLIDTGLAKVEVKSPSSGKLLAGVAEDGKPVEYGQPLFFIQPR